MNTSKGTRLHSAKWCYPEWGAPGSNRILEEFRKDASDSMSRSRVELDQMPSHTKHTGWASKGSISLEAVTLLSREGLQSFILPPIWGHVDSLAAPYYIRRFGQRLGGDTS